MITPAVFYFLRHGETEWNLAGRMMGMADIPLNATGRRQAESARCSVAAAAPQSIAVSPLARAWQTAEIVNRELGCPVIPLDDLREVDVGPYQGTSDPGWMSRWHSGEAMTGVETFAAFCTRIGRGIDQALSFEGPVLIVSHGGVFRAIEHLLGRRQGTDLPNATLVRFDPPAGGRDAWRIALG